MVGEEREITLLPDDPEAEKTHLTQKLAYLI